MVAATAPDLTSFSEGGPTEWTPGGFPFYSRGPKQRVPASSCKDPCSGERAWSYCVSCAESSLEDGKGAAITVGLGVLPQIIGRTLAPPSRCIAEMHVQAVSRLLLHSVTTSSGSQNPGRATCSSAQDEAMATPGHRREVPFQSPSTVTSTLLRSTGGLAIRSAVGLGRLSACRTTVPLPGPGGCCWL